MDNELFKRARDAVCPSIIQGLFPDEQAEIRNGEYFIRSPLRHDKSVGSFHINLETGQYIDHATGDAGTLIDLIMASKGLTSKQSAELILGTKPVDTVGYRKTDKPDPVIPIPNVAVKVLLRRIAQPWSVKRYGKKPEKGGWKYYTYDGKFAFVTIRHEKQTTVNGKLVTKKDVIPYYYGTDNKWHQGRPIRQKIPLFNGHKIIASDRPVLLVEGEKCASVPVNGYDVVTWQGGSNNIKRADWSILKTKNVIIWPDHDAAGMKTLDELRKILPHAEYLDIPIDKPDTWDIYDAVQDGIDPVDFISANLHIEHNEEKKVVFEEVDFTHEFRFLGCTAEYHWFLPFGYFEPIKTKRGSVNSSFLYELAPYYWWEENFAGKNGVDTATAINWLIRRSQQEGKYKPERLRGTGVWRDGDDLIINTGKDLVQWGKNEHIAYNEYDSHTNSIYVIGRSSMDNMQGRTATLEDGENLVALVLAHQFIHRFDAYTAIGWAIMAPFASALSWRPHIWISGQKGSGKSFFIANVIQPIIGDYGLFGSGRHTEAGTRRSIGQDGRPVILDEMEPRTQEARKKLDALLDLARNASSDASASMVMAGHGSTDVVEFKVRGPFCFASVVPYLDGAAIESRFTVCHLQSLSDSPEHERKKIDACTEILTTTQVMDDPAKYRRKLWQEFPKFQQNIKDTERIIIEMKGNAREAEQMAPPLAAIYTVSSDVPIQDNAAWKSEIRDMLYSHDNKHEADEDKLIRELLETGIQTDVAEYMKVSEILYTLAYGKDDGKLDKIIRRFGIRFMLWKGVAVVAIANDHKDIKHALKDTPYHARYGEVLRRHAAAVSGSYEVVRMDSASKRSVILEWGKLEEMFF